VLDLRRGEATAAALSFARFFCLLAASHVLRPIREALGIEGGVYTLPWLWTGTFRMEERRRRDLLEERTT